MELKVYESVDFIYVKDLANGIALAVHTSPLPHQVYNFGSGTLTTVERRRSCAAGNFSRHQHETRQTHAGAAAHGHHTGANRVGIQSRV